jgi:periplasmic protein TonB
LCSGFLRPKPKPDDSQVLEAIPANIIDAAFRSGVHNAQPPTPQPQVTPPQPPQQQVQPPTPPQPKQVVQPPPEPQDKPLPDDTKPVEKPDPRPKHEIKPDLTMVTRDKSKVTDDAKAEKEAAEKAQKTARKLQADRIKAIQRAANNIRNNTSSSTTVDMPGDSSVAYADYASVVKTVYTEAWQLPESADSDDANVKVSVTIASDGRVTEAHIVEKSGDSSVDASVQRTLDRVSQIEPFPEGSTDKERTYIINFNLKAKRMLG